MPSPGTSPGSTLMPGRVPASVVTRFLTRMCRQLWNEFGALPHIWYSRLEFIEDREIQTRLAMCK